MKFVRFLENTKRAPDVYAGIVLESTPDHTKILGFDDDDDVRDFGVHVFPAGDDWTMESCSSDHVLHTFRQHEIKKQCKVLDAEFELEQAKYRLKLAKKWLADIEKMKLKK